MTRYKPFIEDYASNATAQRAAGFTPAVRTHGGGEPRRSQRCIDCAARPGFTLIELIVVISIIIVLAAIAAFILPSLLERERASQGASQVQGWMMIARGRALRDQAPRGIRLNLNTDLFQSTGSLFVTDLQYIEQPDDLSGGQVGSIDNIKNTVTFSGVDFTNGATVDTTNPDNVANWQVQPGDYLEIKGGGTMYRITAVVNSGGNKAGVGDMLVLGSSPLVVTTPTWQYRIVRQPRILAGEDSLQLPKDVAIDLGVFKDPNSNKSVGFNGGNRNFFNLNTILSPLGVDLINNPNNLPPYLDILFDRYGNVVGQSAIFDKIVLWVRDVTLADDNGDQTLMAINSRSGLVESHAVNFDAGLGDNYVFTRDGQSSGT